MFQGLRIPVMIIAFIGSLGLALAVQHVLHGAQVTSPLVNELEAQAGVASVELESDQGLTVVVIDVDGAIELSEQFPKWLRTAQRRLGSEFGGIRLVDTRDERLSEAYYQLHFGVAEAAMTGRFRELRSEAERIAEAMNLSDYRLQISADYIYIQLEADGKYLYEVIRRPALAGEGERGTVSR